MYKKQKKNKNKLKKKSKKQKKAKKKLKMKSLINQKTYLRMLKFNNYRKKITKKNRSGSVNFVNFTINYQFP